MSFFPLRAACRSFALGTVLLAAPALALAQAYLVKPLMIIRFNQPVVRYERALDSAISRAVEAKPDARFTLVAFAPSYGDAATQAQLAERTRTQLSEVRSHIIADGISSSRIDTTTRASSAITHDEVHILVR